MITFQLQKYDFSLFVDHQINALPKFLQFPKKELQFFQD